jgi:Uma2 family endonuclease
MSTTAPPPAMTLDQLLALPDDGMDRELIRGELRERPTMLRDRRHGSAAAAIGSSLENWREQQPRPGGLVVAGDAGFRLSRNPDTVVGIDVAYVSAEIASRDPDAPYFEGTPVLAVEILSPSDSQADIDDKVALYLELGVAIVWVVNPLCKTIRVYRSDAAPVLFHEDQSIDAEPHLPGFRAALKSMF